MLRKCLLRAMHPRDIHNKGIHNRGIRRLQALLLLDIILHRGIPSKEGIPR
jgi:hypothetical protein